VCHGNRVQTSTHGLTIGEHEVRKEYVADHEAEAEREWAILTLLAEHAPGFAPRPIRRDDGATPVIVMERLRGEPLAPRPLTAARTEALGASLRRLYDVPVEAVVAAGIGPRRYGAREHVPVLVEWLGDDHDLGECRDPVLVAEALDAARAYVAAPALPEPRLSALGIADLNPANVLVHGRTVRLVDFEDGGLSDPAYELADHVEHLGSRLPGCTTSTHCRPPSGWTRRRSSGWPLTARCSPPSGSRCCCRATAPGDATRRGRPRSRPSIS
jgi:Ser/Thr protein kinase RdoA (MazF antagonist)